MQTITPVLRILNEDKAREFYVDWLGFTVNWKHRFGDNFPLYMQVSKDGIVLHLTEHYGDCLPGSRIRITISNLESYNQQLKEKDYKFYKPGIVKQEWGTTEMPLIDPFSNHIVFVQQENE